MYAITPPPTEATPENLRNWMYDELSKVLGLFALLEQGQFLDVSTAAPSKPRERQIAFADGTNWNPGSGKGVYCYYNSAWHFLG